MGGPLGRPVLARRVRVPLAFLLDWHSLQVGGVICAGILCAMGIIVLLSEFPRPSGRDGGGGGEGQGRGRATGPLPRPLTSPPLLPTQVGSANASSARSPGKTFLLANPSFPSHTVEKKLCRASNAESCLFIADNPQGPTSLHFTSQPSLECPHPWYQTTPQQRHSQVWAS